MSKRSAVIALLSLLTPGVAYAAGPFGIEIGDTNMEKARSILENNGQVEDAGVNKWSNGPMIRSSGSGFDIRGLNEVLVIGDKDDRVVGVILEMPDDRFDDMTSMLSDNYSLVSKQDPHVGNQSAEFRASDIEINVNAPHLSHSMSIQYLHPTLVEAFRKESKQERREQQQKEKSQL